MFMPKTSKATMDVQGAAVTVPGQASDDYISLTDIAKHKAAGLIECPAGT